MIIKIDEEKIYQYWGKEKIENIAKEREWSFFETIMYLYFFNNVGISEKDRSKDCGRKMYEKFAKATTEFLGVEDDNK